MLPLSLVKFLYSLPNTTYFSEKMFPNLKGKSAFCLVFFVLCVTMSHSRLVTGQTMQGRTNGHLPMANVALNQMGKRLICPFKKDRVLLTLLYLRSLGPLNFFSYLERQPNKEQMKQADETAESMEQSLLLLCSQKPTWTWSKDCISSMNRFIALQRG